MSLESVDVEQSQATARGTHAHRESHRKSLRRLIVLGLIAISVFYVVACLLIFLFQEWLIYFPAPDYRITPADIGLKYEDLTLTTNDGVLLAAWYLPCAGSQATVLFCHGNAGNIADR